MLDLDGPDVWPSTLTKIGEWQRQSYVREGFLTPFDAACFMASEGYGLNFPAFHPLKSLQNLTLR